jgi:hypothetical protein
VVSPTIATANAASQPIVSATRGIHLGTLAASQLSAVLAPIAGASGDIEAMPVMPAPVHSIYRCQGSYPMAAGSVRHCATGTR